MKKNLQNAPCSKQDTTSELWKKFCSSGRIDDYLAYSRNRTGRADA